MSSNPKKSLATGATQLAPPICWEEWGKCDHFVHFYETEAFLVEAVAGFVGGGLGAGEGAIVIATKPHLESLEERLQAHGFDLSFLQKRNLYVALDAQETLNLFLLNDWPDAERFFQTIEPVVARVGQGRRGVRAFGEMVSLLWKAGNQSAAIHLEKLWNTLLQRHSLSLFCAYDFASFTGDAQREGLLEVCQAHTGVIPAESYTRHARSDDRLRTITLLQQKAASFDIESALRRETELLLHEQQTKFSLAADFARVGCWELNLRTLKLECSELCKRHLGLAADQSLSLHTWTTLVQREDRPRFTACLEEAIHNRSQFKIEFRIVDPAGRTRWLGCAGRCPEKQPHQMVGVIADVTEKAQAPELLEQQVAERTARLQENLAEMEAFSYSISHDMRAPLRSIRGYAELLLQDEAPKLSSDAQLWLQRIAASAERMDRLIHDVLTFSRTARSEFELEPIDLDKLLRTIIDSYGSLGQPDAQITICGSLPPVMANEIGLTQCLTNLLGNALKFVSPGVQPVVQIWAEATSALAPGASSRVRICVRDNGIGIPASLQKKIFGIFERLNPKYEGTGVGLAIVKKAIERMGGTVGLQSEPGQGSTFWLELPHADDRLAPAGQI